MVSARDHRDDDQSFAEPHLLTYKAETLRNAADCSQPQVKLKPEDRVSMFWRVFGGTLLSIAALVGITLYQQFSNSLSELRTNLSRLTESRADFVKVDDCNTRFTAVWNSVKELQAANAAVLALKERSALLEQQVKASEEERKELTRELQQLRERQAALEGRQATAATPPATAGPHRQK
jgi:DNA repair exonuclease SbcCD ATPase subunit